MLKVILGLAVIFLFGVNGHLQAEGGHKYVGVKKCSMCHKSEAKGDQYSQWLSTKHSKAYEGLATAESLETAKKAAVSGNPQQSPKCLRCHITGYGEDESLFGTGFVKEDGVQCESCHGAGSDYMGLSVMKDKAKAIEYGLILPTREVCVKCHNAESPNYKEFNFNEFYQKIAHPRPKG